MAVTADRDFHVGPVVITHVVSGWIAAALIAGGLTVATFRLRRSMLKQGDAAASERFRAAAAACGTALGALLLFASVYRDTGSLEALFWGGLVSILLALIFELVAKDLTASRP